MDYNNFRSNYYTQNGMDALIERAKTIYKIYKITPEQNYPVVYRMFGFALLEIKTKEECLGHLRELEQILLIKIEEDDVV